ncbi:MAG: tRNA pseudouridine(38-40) synthase TruA [Alphaproteobacteria bacterium]|nr:tRNA pseudouridine(38-40) synthase TruA [Alphaproteobacteria bacterium]
MRWKLTIEYDGAPFKGWQRQKHAVSVQEIIEQAIFTRFAETVTLHVAGRTDSGVHALQQIAHFDIARTFRPNELLSALNSALYPHPIVILQADKVSENFHARFSAIERRYVYRILNRIAPPAIEANKILHVKYPLDIAAMNDAAICLCGTHDFSAFRAKNCQAKSPIKTIYACGFTTPKESLFPDIHEFYIHANSFLYHQVRNIIGTLIEIGRGKRAVADMQAILESKKRVNAGATAPPDGLYLTKIIYPDGS